MKKRSKLILTAAAAMLIPAVMALTSGCEPKTFDLPLTENGDEYLAYEGKSNYVIVYPENGPIVLRTAAEQLQKYLKPLPWSGAGKECSSPALTPKAPIFFTAGARCTACMTFWRASAADFCRRYRDGPPRGYADAAAGSRLRVYGQSGVRIPRPLLELLVRQRTEHETAAQRVPGQQTRA